ncbi:MAG: FtsW/RodA/SpoVE family cell cycle protein, partial [Butyrivibrio sp.]|nr:FtsW/RodA/SpoVE family cell cycle protein [Butyrivibrio sp.]
MLYSTSSYEAALDYGDSAYYFKHQLFPTILGLVGMMVMSYIPYKVLSRLAMPIYLAAAALLILIIPFGKTVNGAKRWLIIMGVSIQPAEVAKVATIIFTATIIIKLKRNLMSYKGFGVALLFPLILAGMVYGITRNLSSAIIIMGITVVMLFISTPGYKRYIIAAVALLGIVALLVILIANSDQTSGMNYRFERVLAWLDPNAHASGKG